MHIADNELRSHMKFIGTTGAGKLPADKLEASRLVARINEYRSRHGQEALTLFQGSGIYGGHFLCSHRDSKRAQVVELGEHTIINVSAEAFERSFKSMNQFDELQSIQDLEVLAQALDTTISVIRAAVDFCLDHEERLKPVVLP